MAKKSGGKIFLIILGFLVLAGALALITLGLIFVVPDIAKIFKAIPTDIYYIAGGIAGILLSIIILILAFRKADKKIASPVLKEKRQDPNTWNTEKAADKIPRKPPVSTHSTVATSTIKEVMNKQSIVCERCGTENVADTYYCVGCKSALKKICKLCGHDNPYGTTICEGCGKIM